MFVTRLKHFLSNNRAFYSGLQKHEGVVCGWYSTHYIYDTYNNIQTKKRERWIPKMIKAKQGKKGFFLKNN